MKRLLVLSASIATFLVASHPAEAKPENVVYTESYNYKFEDEKDVSNCLNRATVALTKNALSTGLQSHTDEDRRFGYVYGWSSDGTATAEIDCDMDENESNLVYARYSDDQDATFELWKAIRDARW